MVVQDYLLLNQSICGPVVTLSNRILWLKQTVNTKLLNIITLHVKSEVYCGH